MAQDRGLDGIKTIHKLSFTIDDKSTNPADNIYIVKSDQIFYVNVLSFMTLVRFEMDQYNDYDLRDSLKIVVSVDTSKIKTNYVNTTEDWKKIPYNPFFGKK